MLVQSPRARSDAAPPHADVIPLVQFYSIELAPLSDGRVFVGIGATLCEGEGELSNMEILSRRGPPPHRRVCRARPTFETVRLWP
jgi:hypothetical protein